LENGGSGALGKKKRLAVHLETEEGKKRKETTPIIWKKNLQE